MRDYSNEVYQKARKECLTRDKKRCQMPGCKKRTKLVCHHIQRWADASLLRFDVNNLITLCKKCHDSIKDRESYYVSMFLEIINARTN